MPVIEHQLTCVCVLQFATCAARQRTHLLAFNYTFVCVYGRRCVGWLVIASVGHYGKWPGICLYIVHVRSGCAVRDCLHTRSAVRMDVLSIELDKYGTNDAALASAILVKSVCVYDYCIPAVYLHRRRIIAAAYRHSTNTLLLYVCSIKVCVSKVYIHRRLLC